MTEMEENITHIEKDIIKEILNIGLARAADSLAMIARDKVLLELPEIDILEPFQIYTHFNPEVKGTTIQSDIRGDLNGKTYMVFSDAQIAQLAEACLGKTDGYIRNSREMVESLLLEISNILTGSLLTQLANLLGLHVFGSPPKAPVAQLDVALKNIIFDFPVYKPVILTVKTQFVNLHKVVEFPMLIVFDLDSLNKLLDAVRRKYEENPMFLKKT